MSGEDVKLPVAAAAAQAGVPERSLFRAVEKHRIPSTKRDGVTVVDPADVEAWAARRAAALSAGAPATATAGQGAPTAAVMAGSLPAAHGGVAVGSGRTALRPVLDGETTARLIAAFKREEGPVDVAEAQVLPIPLVLEAYEQYQRAKAAAGPSPHQARLDEIQIEMEVACADINGLMGAVGALQRKVAEIEACIASMPMPERGAFTCSCGNTGWVAARLECTVCGKPATWGFHPKKES